MIRRLRKFFLRQYRWYWLRACPDCGSQSPTNWHRASDACADCGRGVVFRNPLRKGGGVIGAPVLESFMAGAMSEDDFAQAALAGGMRAATVLEFIDQRRAEFHDKGEEPPL